MRSTAAAAPALPKHFASPLPVPLLSLLLVYLLSILPTCAAEAADSAGSGGRWRMGPFFGNLGNFGPGPRSTHPASRRPHRLSPCQSQAAAASVSRPRSVASTTAAVLKRARPKPTAGAAVAPAAAVTTSAAAPSTATSTSTAAATASPSSSSAYNQNALLDDEATWVMEEEFHDASKQQRRQKQKKSKQRKKRMRKQEQKRVIIDHGDHLLEEEEDYWDGDSIARSGWWGSSKDRERDRDEKEKDGEEEHPLRTDEWLVRIKVSGGPLGGLLLPRSVWKNRRRLFPQSPVSENEIEGRDNGEREHSRDSRKEMQGRRPLRRANSRRERVQVLHFARNGYVLLLEEDDDEDGITNAGRRNEDDGGRNVGAALPHGELHGELLANEQAMDGFSSPLSASSAPPSTSPSPVAAATSGESIPIPSRPQKRTRVAVGKWKMDHAGLSWDIPVAMPVPVDAGISKDEHRRRRKAERKEKEEKRMQQQQATRDAKDQKTREERRTDGDFEHEEEDEITAQMAASSDVNAADFFSFAAIAAGGTGTRAGEGSEGSKDAELGQPQQRRQGQAWRSTILHYRADVHLNKFGERPRMFRGVVTRDRFGAPIVGGSDNVGGGEDDDSSLSSPPPISPSSLLGLTLPPNLFRPVVATFSAEGIGRDTADTRYQDRGFALETSSQKRTTSSSGAQP